MNQIILSNLNFLLRNQNFPDEFRKFIKTSLIQNRRISELISNVYKLSSIGYVNNKKLENVDIYNVLGKILCVIKDDICDKKVEN